MQNGCPRFGFQAYFFAFHRNPKTSGKGHKDPQEPEFVNDFDHDDDAPESIEASADMRTYVFSATMSKELQKNLKKPAGKRRSIKAEDRGELGALGAVFCNSISRSTPL